MDINNKKHRWWAKKNLLRMTNRHYVICEAIRLLYDDIHYLEDKELRKKLLNRLIDLMIMAKSMSDRLHYYREKYKDSTGKSGTGFPMLTNNQARMKMRKERTGYD